MTKGRQKKGKKKSPVKNSMKGQDYIEVPPNATSYSGPVDTPSMKEQLDCHTFAVRLAGTVATTAGGVMNTVFDAYAQASSANAWPELNALFEEYRILAMRVHMMPIDRYKTSSNNVPFFSVLDRDSSSALTTLNGAASYASAREHAVGDNVTRIIRMDTIEEANWVDNSSSPSTAARLYVKLFGTGMGTSVSYYQYLTTVVVQFRGMRN